jgi:hypothetical protein
MLQRVEREISLTSGVGMTVNGDDTTFFMEFRVCRIPCVRSETWGTRVKGTGFSPYIQSF